MFKACFTLTAQCEPAVEVSSRVFHICAAYVCVVNQRKS